MSKEEDPISQILDKVKPYAGKLTFGSLVGYCSGAAAKKIGKALAVVVGLGFIAVQSAAYSGYVDVNWNKVKDDAIAKVDTDGDGEVTVEDLNNYWKKVRTILTKNVPSAGGFSLGFMYGLKYN